MLNAQQDTNIAYESEMETNKKMLEIINKI